MISKGENLLLARISWADYPELKGHFKSVRLEPTQVLYEARGPIEHTYFPTSGTTSSVVVMSNGHMIEVATVGNEGAIGIPLLAECPSSPNRVFVQIPGLAMRVETALLARTIRQDGQLRKLLATYQEAFNFQVSQSVACNGLHSLPERCCRWILMTHDRAAGDELLLTHEFMSIMLGVRRPSVTETLQALKERKLIRYTRGKIVILDRQGLEDSSCECHQAVRNEYERLLGRGHDSLR